MSSPQAETDGRAQYSYWVGLHPKEELRPEELAELHDYYDTVHVPEVVDRNPGFFRGRRWQLVDSGTTGYEAPLWLAVYDMVDRSAADGYAQRARDGVAVTPPYTAPPAAWKKLRTYWRIIWETMDSRGGCADPDLLFMVGMDPMPGASEAERADFNRFYSDIHVQEVMDSRGFAAGTRARQYAEISYLGDRSPEYSASYESVGGAGQAPSTTPAANLSEGPIAWQHRQVAWRVTYERLRPGAKQGGPRGE